MDFVANQSPQIKEMLQTLGISSIEELFKQIPSALIHPPPKTNDGLSEVEVGRYFEGIAHQNTYTSYLSFLGAGAYYHYIPALVAPLISRSEFLTSYTPYQPEMSQGMLQASFEFQTCMARLTGMDVSNAGVYDAASACSEALLMALRINPERKEVVILETIHPHYLEVIKQVFANQEATLKIIPYETPLEKIADFFDRKSACFLYQSPDFFGKIEPHAQAIAAAKKNEALVIVCGNPLGFALFQSPKELGADIAVGDCQPLGLPLNFGGPYAGFMTCLSAYTRQLPGRIIGETVDKVGKRGFVLTLQAREQHIRREKATSNICTSQTLATLASLITILWYGPQGLQKLALTNYQRAHYLAEQLSKLKGFSCNKLFFNEFTLKCPCDAEQLFQALFDKGIIAGIPLKRFFPSLNQHLLLAVTEMNTKVELARLINTLKELV